MLLRRYGSRIHSVEPKFDPHALTEIGFVRTEDLVLETSVFLERHEKLVEHEIVDRTEGDVKSEVERALLERLLESIGRLLATLGPGEVLLVENGGGPEHPKLRDRTTGKVVGHENRFHFEYTLHPPLRIGHYRPRPE